MKTLLISVLFFVSSLTAYAETYSLKLKLKAGDVFNHESTMSQQIEQQIQGRSIKTSQSNGTTYEMLVQKELNDGFYHVVCTYKQAKMAIENTMMTVKYDSSQKNAPVPPAAAGLAQLIGKSFTLEISNNGEVRNVNGMDKIIDKMLTNLKVNKATKAQMKGQFSNAFGNKSIERLLQQSFKIYPAKKVALKEQWQDTITVKTLYPILITNVWTLNEINKDQAKIGVKSELSSNSSFKMNNVECKTKLTGTQSGTITINRGTGFIENSKIIQEINGTLNMMNLDIPIKINSTVTQRTIQK